MHFDQEKIKRILEDGLPDATATFSDDYEFDDRMNCNITVRMKQPPCVAATALLTFINDGVVKIQKIEVVNNALFGALQNQGIGKKILSNIAAATEALGTKRMVLSADEMGSYVWARAGFLHAVHWDKPLRQAVLGRINQLDVSESEKTTLRETIETSSDRKWLWEIAAWHDQIGVGLLRDIKYDAALNLENPEEMARFKEYTTLTEEQKRAVKQLLAKDATQEASDDKYDALKELENMPSGKLHRGVEEDGRSDNQFESGTQGRPAHIIPKPSDGKNEGVTTPPTLDTDLANGL